VAHQVLVAVAVVAEHTITLVTLLTMVAGVVALAYLGWVHQARLAAIPVQQLKVEMAAVVDQLVEIQNKLLHIQVVLGVLMVAVAVVVLELQLWVLVAQFASSGPVALVHSRQPALVILN